MLIPLFETTRTRLLLLLWLKCWIHSFWMCIFTILLTFACWDVGCSFWILIFDINHLLNIAFAGFDVRFHFCWCLIHFGHLLDVNSLFLNIAFCWILLSLLLAGMLDSLFLECFAGMWFLFWNVAICLDIRSSFWNVHCWLLQTSLGYCICWCWTTFLESFLLDLLSLSFCWMLNSLLDYCILLIWRSFHFCWILVPHRNLYLLDFVFTFTLLGC